MTDPKIIELAQSLTDEQWHVLYYWDRYDQWRGSHGRLPTETAEAVLAYVRELADEGWETFELEWLRQQNPLGRAVLRERERRNGKT